jgi:hypothetical protein
MDRILIERTAAALIAEGTWMNRVTCVDMAKLCLTIRRRWVQRAQYTDSTRVLQRHARVYAAMARQLGGAK